MKVLRGIIHVHSTYSYDGHHPLEDIARYAAALGHGFIAMSEHSDTFDRLRMYEYADACHRLSTPGCLLIAGIEFRCDGDLHILGLGISDYVDATDPHTVARFIREAGGVAVVAHPRRCHYRIPPTLVPLVDGIEVWNAAYDGRFVPNPCCLAVVEQLRRRVNPALLAFGAQDLHRISDQRVVELSVSCAEATKASVLAALKAGRFTISNSFFRLVPTAAPGPIASATIRLSSRLYRMAKTARGIVEFAHVRLGSR